MAKTEISQSLASQFFICTVCATGCESSWLGLAAPLSGRCASHSAPACRHDRLGLGHGLVLIAHALPRPRPPEGGRSIKRAPCRPLPLDWGEHGESGVEKGVQQGGNVPAAHRRRRTKCLLPQLPVKRDDQLNAYCQPSSSVSSVSVPETATAREVQLVPHSQLWSGSDTLCLCRGRFRRSAQAGRSVGNNCGKGNRSASPGFVVHCRHRTRVDEVDLGRREARELGQAPLVLIDLLHHLRTSRL